jgi:hypothetical protein
MRVSDPPHMLAARATPAMAGHTRALDFFIPQIFCISHASASGPPWLFGVRSMGLDAVPKMIVGCFIFLYIAFCCHYHENKECFQATPRHRGSIYCQATPNVFPLVGMIRKIQVRVSFEGPPRSTP